MKTIMRKGRTNNAAIMNFPTAVAMCAARAALRPFLRHRDASFMAILEVPANIDPIFYHHAASALLDRRSLYDDLGNPLNFVARLDQISVAADLHRILDAKRSVILIKDGEKVDETLRLIADVEVAIGAPQAAHFSAAARMLGMPEMKASDAEYLAGLDFYKVRLAFRSGRSLRAAMNRLYRFARASEKSVVRQPQKRAKTKSPGRTLHETAGYGDAAKWGLRLADDIAAWQAGEIEWEDVDRGAVLYGRSGCGKTTYGRILAATCGLSIIEASSARWQAAGHLGDMLKAMRKTFDAARKKAPCILFLDEFDAFGDRSSDTAGDNIDYKRQVIDALLECLDPPEGREGVVVVAATNFPNFIDPALLRPGRLERLINIPLPDSRARAAILRHHLRDTPAPDDLSGFMEMSVGFTGADIELLARVVRRRARLQKRVLTEADLLEALPGRRELSAEELRVVAIHEAGHAILSAINFPEELQHVFISKRVPLDDRPFAVGHIEYVARRRLFETEESLSSRVDVHLAGLAAERVIIGRHSTSAGGSDLADLKLATDLAAQIERCFGYGETLLVDFSQGKSALENLRTADPRLRRAVDARLRSSLNRAEAMIANHRVEVEKLAKLLISKSVVEGSEVMGLLSSRNAIASTNETEPTDFDVRKSAQVEGFKEASR